MRINAQGAGALCGVGRPRVPCMLCVLCVLCSVTGDQARDPVAILTDVVTNGATGPRGGAAGCERLCGRVVRLGLGFDGVGVLDVVFRVCAA